LILMLLALCMLATSDIVNLVQQVSPFEGSPGMEIKDPRFFGALAAFPALHVLLTWMRRDNSLAKFDYIALAGQTAVLAFIIHVRWSTLWVLPVLFIYIVFVARKHGRRFLLPAGLVALVAAIGIVLPTLTAHPLYRIDGDLLHHPLWHNMMTSLQNHPTWGTKYLPAVNNAMGDEMPGEIAKQEIATLPPEERSHDLDSHIDHPNPPAINFLAHKRLMEILESDPRVVIETFFVVLPRHLWRSIANYHSSHLMVLTPLVVLVWIISIGFSAWVASTDPEMPETFGWVAPIA